MENIEVSIVVPVYNSENTLAELSHQISVALKDFRYELILVDDRSRDRSWNIIVHLSENDPRARGVRLKKNSGQDNAIMAGMSKARGNFVVIMDDDLQHAPSDIIKLYEECRKGFDICYGYFTVKRQSFWKNAGSKVNDYVAELFLKKPQGLYLSPFKIIQRDLVKEIIRYQGPFPYVDGVILSLTSNITQIPLTHHPRFTGRSNYNLLRSVSVFLKHVTGYSLYPLRIATLMGVIASSCSFLLGVYFLIDYLTNDVHVEGWITLVLLLVFFNGLLLMCVGLIGEYIGRIYLTVTSKPQYVIDNVNGQGENGRCLTSSRVGETSRD